MTTQEKINQKEKELAELKAQLEKEQNDPKIFVSELLNGLTVKIDAEKYPNSTFFFRGDEVILELEKSDETTYLWCRYSNFWNPISEKFSLDYSETKQLIKEMVEEHFKMSDVTPWIVFFTCWFQVEEHFKMSDVTPFINIYIAQLKVEEHFKMSDVTPSKKKSK